MHKWEELLKRTELGNGNRTPHVGGRINALDIGG